MSLVTLTDLKTFVNSYACSDICFEEALIKFLTGNYLDKEEGTKKLTSRLEKAFKAKKNIGNRWHSYYVIDWDKVSTEAWNILEDARRMYDMGNATASLQVAYRMFELTDKESFDEMDPYEEEDMDLGDLLEGFGKLLVDSLSSDDIPRQVKKDVVNGLRKMTKSEMNDYGYIDIDELLQEASAVALGDEAMLEMLDSMIKETTKEYDLPSYVRRKVDLLEKMGRESDAEATIRQFLYLPEIRKDEVDKAIDDNDLERALRLAEEGRQIAVEKHVDWTETEWMKTKLNIYSRMGNTPNQISIARQLFVRNKGSMDYYKQLKSLVPQEEWKEFLSKLLGDTDMRVIFGSSIEADIYVAEGCSDSLFHLLMDKGNRGLDLFDNYARYVNKEHVREILNEYVVLTKDYAGHNMGAKHYIRIRRAMEAMCKLKGGKAVAHELAAFFRLTYPRRPSFMAEIKNF